MFLDTSFLVRPVAMNSRSYCGRCGQGNVWPLALDTGIFRLVSCLTSAGPAPWSSWTADRTRTGLEFWPQSLAQNWMTPPSNPWNEIRGRIRRGVPLPAWPRPGLLGRTSSGWGSAPPPPLSVHRVGWSNSVGPGPRPRLGDGDPGENRFSQNCRRAYKVPSSLLSPTPWGWKPRWPQSGSP